jgi:hypothetical protein
MFPPVKSQLAQDVLTLQSAKPPADKFRVFQALRHTLNGLLAPVTNLFQGPVQFLGGLGMIAVGGKLVAMGAGPLLLSLGLLYGGVEAVLFAKQIWSAKNHQDQERAFHHLGLSLSSLLPSVYSAKGALRGYLPSAKVGAMNRFEAIWANFKSIPKVLERTRRVIRVSKRMHTQSDGWRGMIQAIVGQKKWEGFKPTQLLNALYNDAPPIDAGSFLHTSKSKERVSKHVTAISSANS